MEATSGRFSKGRIYTPAEAYSYFGNALGVPNRLQVNRDSQGKRI